MNSNQLITNAEALRLFFTDDVYLVGNMTTTEGKAQETAPSPSPKLAVQSGEAVAKAVYKEPIAELPKLEEPVANYEPSFDFKYLGKNEKGILILVNDASNPVSTPEGTELLRKLVLSIHLKNADFALLNYSAYANAKFKHLSSFFACKYVLSFGVAPTALGLAEQALHQLSEIENIKFIFTHHLHELDGDVAAKKLLWGTLKNLKI
jgi:hypothetical protein